MEVQSNDGIYTMCRCLPSGNSCHLCRWSKWSWKRLRRSCLDRLASLSWSLLTTAGSVAIVSLGAALRCLLFNWSGCRWWFTIRSVIYSRKGREFIKLNNCIGLFAFRISHFAFRISHFAFRFSSERTELFQRGRRRSC